MSRRMFIGGAGAAALGFGGLRRFWENPASAQAPDAGYGPLQPDADGLLSLPPGFRYHAFSRTGERMDDGLLVPGAHDGMAAFPGPDGKTILVRNHELAPEDQDISWFGRAGAGGFDRSRFYDPPATGGTTTLVYDTRAGRLDHHAASLAGTLLNCAGGPTPWGTWISCEETLLRANGGLTRDHGYNFEVAPLSPGLVQPVALTAMGRFNHEAIAVDAATGVVYQTEDRSDGLFYRFIPLQAGNLAAGGRLQALCLEGMEGADTSNHTGAVMERRTSRRVSWVDLEEVEAPDDGLRAQGAAKGAARFARGEGLWADGRSIYFSCTIGGPAQCGQIWRYLPSPFEGTSGEHRTPGLLELFAEASDAREMQNADNITVAPWGDVIVCEDGPAANRIIGVTPAGRYYPLAANTRNDSEFAGAAFSPDGGTLFVNIQRPGVTLAITGPWTSPE